MEGRLALGFVADQKQMQDTDAQIEAIQDNITDDHDRYEPEPDKTHPLLLLFDRAYMPAVCTASGALATGAGPELISRYIRTVNSSPSNV